MGLLELEKEFTEILDIRQNKEHMEIVNKIFDTLAGRKDFELCDRFTEFLNDTRYYYFKQGMNFHKLISEL